MKHNLARGLLSALVTAALVLGATTFAQTAVEPLDPPQQVRVAYVPILKFATLYVAADRGLFEKYGLDVSIDSVASGTEAIAFLEQGQIDVGGIAIVTSLWNGWNQASTYASSPLAASSRSRTARPASWSARTCSTLETSTPSRS